MAAVVLGWPVAAIAQPVAEPPEAAHFDRTRFLIGLREQGLFDLQAAFMEAYPPADDAQKAWYQRERLLAQALPGDVPMERRLDLLRQADEPAGQAVQAEPHSPRTVLWQVDRAQTWLYQASRPLFEQILFYGATPALRRNLKQAATTAAGAYDQAIQAITAYQEQLASPAGRALAQQAEPLNMNTFGLLRQMQFERGWVQLQQAFAMERGDVEQALLAAKVINGLLDQHLLESSGDAGPMHAQSLFLAAIASRLQGDWPAVRERLGNVLEAFEALPPAAQASIDWLWLGIGIEQVRLQLDQGQYAQALGILGDLRSRLAAAGATAPQVLLARRLSVAMVEFETMTLAADAAVAAGNKADQVLYATKRFDALAALAGEAPDSRPVIYQFTADRMGRPRDPTALPAFAKAACAWRALADKKYADAIEVAQALDQETASRRDYLNHDAVLMAATALQESKQHAAAAEAWVRFAREWPQDPRAAQAAQTALGLMGQDREALASSAGRQTFIEAGELLLRLSPETARRQEWVLPLAEAMLLEGRFDRAAELFQQVPRDSGQYVQAVRGRILAVSGKLRYARADQDAGGVKREAQGAVDEAVQFARQVSPGTTTQPSASGTMAGEVLLAAAQLCVEPLGDPRRALELLDGLQSQWQQDPARLARVLGVRIQAYQKMGNLDEATKLVDGFMAGSPDTAGAMLTLLLGDMQREIEQQQRLGQREQAAKYVSVAVKLAQQLEQWAAQHPGSVKPEQRYAIQFRLAKALTQAGRYDEALKLFDALAKENAAKSGGQVRDAGVLAGQAEALFHLARYAEARDVYLRIWRAAAIRSDLWWQALLGSLQAAARLNEDPDKILKVIRQHRNLYPSMGGRELDKQFTDLQLEMLERIKKASAGQ